MSDLTNEFTILFAEYQRVKKELTDLELKYQNKPKTSNFEFMRDIHTNKLRKITYKINRTGTSKSIIYATGTFYETTQGNLKSPKRFDIYFINEILMTDIELLLAYYIKDLIDFKASIIPTGKAITKRLRK